MKFQVKHRTTLLAMAIAAACSTAAVASQFEVNIDRSKLTTNAAGQSVGSYIVQLDGQTGIEKAAELGELTPNNQLVGAALNQYNSQSPAIIAYNKTLLALQTKLAAQFSTGMLYSYTHTFNGFSARMTGEQAAQLRLQPGVVGVWEDKPEQVDTSNTIRQLGLLGSNGQHTNGIKGDGIVIGVVDTGIWPEHPSFADDGSYGPLENWRGTCDAGEKSDFTCNNKLIGARYFKSSFESVYAIQPGEFISPRDADNHGSHTSSTAAGNEGVSATVGGQAVGVISGVAPRARIAMYKACWNSDYVSPAGVQERGCFYGDTMAAIDAAVADGVDVINYSIGGSLDDLTTIAAAAKLRATQAGVLVSVSAGNSGANNTMETVGTPAPWVVSVAASGVSVNAIQVNGGSLSGKLGAVEGSVGRSLKLTGDVTSDVAVAMPLDACTNLTNAADLVGKVALIQRGGGCGFADKIARAQGAGATAMLVFNNTAAAPTAMGGVFPNPQIPAVMISMANGNSIKAAIDASEVVNVTFSPDLAANVMADFSSKGPNKATYDILKPDITAPGSNVLAAGTPEPFTKPKGESFAYLSGTSMAAPHIAGMAALLKQQHPDWSPAMVKSALMTTAHQDVLKSNSTLKADLFDFGAGHAAPVAAANPGLVYDATANHYYAFMCGLGRSAFVQAASGFSCAEYTNAGYPTEASQLNQPAIAVSKLQKTRTIVREVTNVTDTAAVYSPQIELAGGIKSTFKVLQNGNLVAANELAVPANGKAVYAVTFDTTGATTYNNWNFGSLTLSDGVHSVRSPIAIKAIEPQLIVAPESATINVAAKSGRLSLPLEMNYSGTTSSKLVGLSQAYGSSRTVNQDADGTFAFNEASLGTHILTVPAGTKVARFSLRNQLTDLAAPNLDLYVYRCAKWSCSFVTSAQNADANEDIVLLNPAAANDSNAGDVYIVWVHPRDLNGAASVNYTMAYWIVNAANTATSSIVSSTRAIEGRPNIATIMTKNLVPGGLPYMGVATFHDATGKEQDSTLLEVFAN
jgi:subtilisin family serine protease